MSATFQPPRGGGPGAIGCGLGDVAEEARLGIGLGLCYGTAKLRIVSTPAGQRVLADLGIGRGCAEGVPDAEGVEDGLTALVGSLGWSSHVTPD